MPWAPRTSWALQRCWASPWDDGNESYPLVIYPFIGDYPFIRDLPIQNAIQNVDLPIQNGDFPVRYVSHYQINSLKIAIEIRDLPIQNGWIFLVMTNSLRLKMARLIC